MIKYEKINSEKADELFLELGDLLQACVRDGASVGFTDPEDRQAIDSFWRDKINSLSTHDCELLIALEQGLLAATVIINYSGMPNGRHRAEISKLLVHPKSRRQGIATRLMNQAEQIASKKGISLLVLDTRSGDVASDLYLSLDWQVAGSIPFYAKSVDNTLDTTTYMYKINKIDN